MDESTKAKNIIEEGQYKKLKHEIQKLYREAKNKYYEDKCKGIDILDKLHSHLLFQKIKELRPRRNKMLNSIKNKQEKVSIEKDEVKERLSEYVEGW